MAEGQLDEHEVAAVVAVVVDVQLKKEVKMSQKRSREDKTGQNGVKMGQDWSKLTQSRQIRTNGSK